MNAIPANKYVPVVKESFWASLFGEGFFAPRMKMSYAFAGGALAGILLLMLFTTSNQQQSQLNLDDLQGTMVLNESLDDLQLLESGEINNAGLSGNLTVKYSDRLILLDLSVNSIQSTHILLRFPQDDIRFRGFLPESQSSNTLVLNDSELKLSHNGNNRYAVLLRRTENPIQLEVLLSQSASNLYKKQYLIPGE